VNFEAYNKLYLINYILYNEYIIYYTIIIIYIISDYFMKDITIEITTLRILMYINVFIMNFGVKKV